MAIVLGLISGILNVIPYIGPWIGGIIGVLISMTEIGLNIPDAGVVIITLALIFFVTHMIDVFLFQPYIYSNSVQAHPLEIFIVILIASSIGGIIGMLVAIPAYTVIRVFAREFFSNFKLVQKLTEKID
jgi:predicted PurR-regulated permease PerM